MPSTVDISRDEFLRYRDAWKVYRSLGRYDGNEQWIQPLSFSEALEMPKAMLDTFQELDHFLAQMKAYKKKKQGKQGS